MASWAQRSSSLQCWLFLAQNNRRRLCRLPTCINSCIVHSLFLPRKEALLHNVQESRGCRRGNQVVLGTVLSVGAPAVSCGLLRACIRGKSLTALHYWFLPSLPFSRCSSGEIRM